MNINHIVIILLVVILLFMTFAPRPLSYTFRRSPYRKCEYGEVGCDPDSRTPEHYRRSKGRHRHGKSPWEKEVRHRMRHRRGDERRQRRSNRGHRYRESLVEGLATAGTCTNCNNATIVANLGSQYNNQVDEICKTRNNVPDCLAVGGMWSSSGPGPGPTRSGSSFNPNCPPPKPAPQVPPPPGGATQGPPYLSYDCQDGYCLQVPRATGNYWSKDCDGNCKPPPPPSYPPGGYPDHGYPTRGGPAGGPSGPQYCPA